MELPHKDSAELFKGRHFGHELITLCVRWYVTYKLSYRDLVAIMAERNVDVAHTTILRWVQRYVPEFEQRWQRYARPVGPSWRVDETYIKVKGKWAYLYRAVDKAGQTIDFFLSERRDITAAKGFFQQAIEKRGVPEKVTLDGYAASQEAVVALQEEGTLPLNLIVRTNRYLNNLIEQDHRRVKQRLRSMLGFKRFDHAVVTPTGIELIHQINKGQFDLSTICPTRARVPPTSGKQCWQPERHV
jgi:transposase-like protein